MLWLDVPFWHVLLLFIIKLVFLSFSFLFWRNIKFPQQNICKLKTRIGHQKLSVELCAMFPRNKSLNQQLKYVPWNRCYWIIDKILEMYSRRRSSNIEALKTATLLQTNLILILIIKYPDHILIRSWPQKILIKLLVISYNFGVL